mmetsp:Transcript_39713/g.60863  ORF Transcript_39713/g.60863 Transcript_39713/m.60863 type:complete len:93 (+) Transcript_39713:485-763(+)
MQELNTDVQWRVHTCFPSCQDPNAHDAMNYDFDNRPLCSDPGIVEEILCVHPYVEKNCETYQKKSRTCFDEEKLLCVGWIEIIIAIVLANVC